MNSIFSSADILLPNFINNSENAKKWAVVACDQYTSEPEYWQNVYSAVNGAPSTLNMILPEVYLAGDNSSRLKGISKSMAEYLNGCLKTHSDALIFVRRTVSGGKIRCGIVGKVDLEAYDYSADSNSPIRATEGTVLERIPPRVAVRRNATVELPHIMLLINDDKRSVIEPLNEVIGELEKLYDFDLLFSNHIEGYLLPEIHKQKVITAMEELFLCGGISLAVGDGNHSLASAKARYEELKGEIGEEKAKLHPLRYALCEVVNLHDDSLEFEPIYRLVKTSDVTALLCALKEYASKCFVGTQEVKCICNGKESNISLGSGTHSLTVGTLQKFLDEYKALNPDIEIDYIHGLDSIKKLSDAPDAVGFVFEGMRKEELFSSVEKDGALPRKTFSMGEACDKRYYIECRKISE